MHNINICAKLDMGDTGRKLTLPMLCSMTNMALSVPQMSSKNVLIKGTTAFTPPENTAVVDSLITGKEAKLFDDVHTQMDALLAGQPMGPGRMADTGQDDVLAQLMAEGTFTEAQIQSFNDIHHRLLMAGLMVG